MPSVSEDRGSITAEFAAVVPAVMLVLAGAMMCLQLGSQQLRLQDAAAVTARAIVRGEAAPTYDGAAVATSQSGNLLCVTLSLAARPPLFVQLRAQSCAIK